MACDDKSSILGTLSTGKKQIVFIHTTELMKRTKEYMQICINGIEVSEILA